MTLAQLIEKRAALVRQQREMLDAAAAENRDLTASELSVYNGKDGEVTSLTAQIQRQQTLEARENELRGQVQPTVAAQREQPGGGFDPRETQPGEIRTFAPNERLVGNVAYRRLEAGIRPEELNFGRALRGLVTGDWRNADAERRAMSQSGSGQYLLPEPLALNVIDLARAQTRVFQAGAMTFPMETSSINLARVLGDVTPAWKAENAPGTESDMSFGQITLEPRTLFAITRASVEMIDDAPNAGNLIERSLAAAMAGKLDAALLFGEGTGLEPLGLRNWPGINTVTGVGAPAYDDFSSAVEKITTANGPNADLSAILSTRDAGTLDRLKDTTNQPLLPPESYKAIRKLPTTQVPTNLGAGSNESEIFVGYFPDMLVGMRTDVVIELSREAEDAFKNYQVLIRAVLRADMIIQHAGFFTHLSGTTAS